MNHLLHRVYEKEESLDLFQMPALPFSAKAGRSSAGMGVILMKMRVHGRLRAVHRGQRRGLLTNDPALSPLFPFCMFYTARSTVMIRDCEGKLGKCYGIGRCLTNALIWQQEYLCLKLNCCCKVDLLTPVVVANSATSFTYESQSTLEWKDSELEFLTTALERGVQKCNDNSHFFINSYILAWKKLFLIKTPLKRRIVWNCQTTHFKIVTSKKWSPNLACNTANNAG